MRKTLNDDDDLEKRCLDEGVAVEEEVFWRGEPLRSHCWRISTGVFVMPSSCVTEESMAETRGGSSSVVYDAVLTNGLSKIVIKLTR